MNSTTVDITTLTSFKDLVSRLTDCYETNLYKNHINDSLVTFSFEDIKWGELEDEENALKEHGIPYMLHIHEDYEIEEEYHYYHFDSSGTPIYREHSERALYLYATEIQKLLNKSDPLSAIKKEVDRINEISALIDWTNQEQYSKLFQINKLIDPGINND